MRPLTDRQADVLDTLAVLGRESCGGGSEWWRPMDFGGYDGGHHSQTAAALVKRGLVERKRFTVGVSSGHWRYRISEAGNAHLASLEPGGGGR